MLIGNNDSLIVRAQVDENDAWRVAKDAPALGYPRGQESLAIPLTFERYEPYIVPKRSLTGDSSERVEIPGSWRFCTAFTLFRLHIFLSASRWMSM